MQTSYKVVIEDSSRNKYMFYHTGSSVCCKEVSKDGVSRDFIIASQVSENFLAAIDLKDNLYVVCINRDKGLYLFSYVNGEWKLDQILNIQGSESIILLSLFVYNGSIHIIYTKQLAIANFYSIHHLYKSSSTISYHLNTSWRKNNVGEVYSEDINTAYSAIITKDGILHLVYEWFDGSSYQINHSWYDSLSNVWKKKAIATLFKKNITVNILCEDNNLHLLCYTFEDEVSVIFYYTKKDGTAKDFDFYCLDKIKTEQAVTPYFHVESGSVYASWIIGNKFSQYSISKDQKNWSKKLDNIIPEDCDLQLIQYIRNRRGKALIFRKTYFTVDNKNNISFPYFKDSASDILENYINKTPKNAEEDLMKYIPYILDELKSLSQAVKSLQERFDQSEGYRMAAKEYKTSDNGEYTIQGRKTYIKEGNILKKSNFRERFMSSNKLLSRPEAAALYVGSSAIPNPDELTKKEGIEIVENNEVKDEKNSKESTPAAPEKASKPEPETPAADTPAPAVENKQQDHEHEVVQKDTNLFKKIGEFFK